jgi:hypothetical protein
MKMYAYIIDRLWLQYPNKNYAEFLRVVGTPALITDPDGNFNTVSGFYVQVEDGWAVRFRSELQYMTVLDLDSDLNVSLESLNLGS